MSCVGKEGFPSIQSRLQSSKEDGGSKDVGARTGVTRWGFREAHVVVFKSFLKAVGLEVDSEESLEFPWAVMFPGLQKGGKEKAEVAGGSPA